MYWDIRLIALLRILSCFLEASAALLGQVQVCVDSGDTLSAVRLLARTRCNKRFLDMFSCLHFSGWCLLSDIF